MEHDIIVIENSTPHVCISCIWCIPLVCATSAFASANLRHQLPIPHPSAITRTVDGLPLTPLSHRNSRQVIVSPQGHMTIRSLNSFSESPRLPTESSQKSRSVVVSGHL